MIRFYNGKVLTMDGSFDVTADEVWVNATGYAMSAKLPTSSRSLSVRSISKAISSCRALKDAHTHSAMTSSAPYADDLPLNDWLFKKVFPLRKSSYRSISTGSTSWQSWNIAPAGSPRASTCIFFRRAFAEVKH